MLLCCHYITSFCPLPKPSLLIAANQSIAVYRDIALWPIKTASKVTRLFALHELICNTIIDNSQILSAAELSVLGGALSEYLR